MLELRKNTKEEGRHPSLSAPPPPFGSRGWECLWPGHPAQLADHLPFIKGSPVSKKRSVQRLWHKTFSELYWHVGQAVPLLDLPRGLHALRKALRGPWGAPSALG